MNPTYQKMDISDYYKKLPELQGTLRNRIVARLEYKSLMTFYNKLNNNSWSGIEREAVEKIIEEFSQEVKTSIL